MELLRKKNCVLYARVSSVDQVKNWNWLDSQLTACRNYCMKNELFVIEEFKDWWVTWSNTNRKWLQQMIDFIKDTNNTIEKIDYIILDDIDRLSRDILDFFQLKKELNEMWVKMFSLKQDINETPEWNYMLAITMATKQYEKENNARRTRVRMMARLQNWYFTFYPPHGYEYIKDPNWPWSVLVKNADAELIWEAIKRYANIRDFSMYDVHRFLNEKWVRSRKAKTLHWSFIERLLEKERLIFYAGYIDIPRYWLIMIKWKHEAIIDLETMNKVISKKESRRKQFYKKYSKEDILENLILRWFLVCPKCKHRITWWAVKWRTKHYFYYTCSNCWLYWASKIKIDEALKNKLNELNFDDEIITMLSNSMKQIIEKNDETGMKLITEKEKDMVELEVKIPKLIKKLLDLDDKDIIDILQKELKEAKSNVELLKQEIEKLRENLDTTPDKYENILTRISWLFKDTRWLFESLSLEEKRKFINLFLWDVLYYDIEKDELTTPNLNPIFSLIRKPMDWNFNINELSSVLESMNW